jgi:large subunit ribosomal protein L6
MSRIGKKPIVIPKGVTIKVSPEGIEVQGPKGKLRQYVPPGIDFKQEDGTLVAKPQRDEPALGKFHGLARSLVANAVTGVTEGFKKSSTSSASATAPS